MVVVPSRHSLEYVLASAEIIEFNGVNTTGFLKNFLVLMYLFVFFDFVKSCC